MNELSFTLHIVSDPVEDLNYNVYTEFSKIQRLKKMQQ